jgi:hypothetical protein
MTIYCDVIGKMGNSMVINKLKKFTWKKTILDNFLTYKCFFENYQKLIMIWTYENMSHSKLHSFFLLSFFYQNFYNYVPMVLYLYYILSPYKIFQIKIIHNNAYIGPDK